MLILRSNFEQPYRAVQVGTLCEAAKKLCLGLDRSTAVVYGQDIYVVDSSCKGRRSESYYCAFHSDEDLLSKSGKLYLNRLCHLGSFWAAKGDLFLVMTIIEGFRRLNPNNHKTTTKGALVLDYGNRQGSEHTKKGADNGSQ